MAEAIITPDVLRWARERADFSQDDAAQKVKVRPDRFNEWENGQSRPTFRQAQILAQAFHIPFGYFFLPAPPPEEQLDLPDLRTIGGIETTQFSLNFVDHYFDLLRKQEWIREYRLNNGFNELTFIAKYSFDDSYKTVAHDIQKELAINPDLRNTARNWEEYISKFIEQAESAGILVMRNSIVGTNTHRPLSVEEFRGLAICDKIAPLVFINSADAKSAQLFTLAHELAHLWLGQSGVSNPDLRSKKNGGRNNNSETFCNKIAAEILVPEDSFLESWNRQLAVADNLDLLSKIYRVSRLVISRRAYELDLIEYADFQEFYLAALNTDRNKKIKQSQSSGGPSFYTTQKSRNGKLFSQSVIAAAFSGKLPLRDAGSLLGVKPGNIRKYAQKVNE
jgi:Zn-dependent peptidase ImmA (M78 family)/DNA-binding XRE family transcriptional regulator